MLDLLTPDAFRGDPYGWLTNQMSHVLAGLGGAWLVLHLAVLVGAAGRAPELGALAAAALTSAGLEVFQFRRGGAVSDGLQDFAFVIAGAHWTVSGGLPPALGGDRRGADRRHRLSRSRAQELTDVGTLRPESHCNRGGRDLFMITRGSGAALEVEKVDPAAAATAELIATGIDALLGGDGWRTGGGAGGGAANTVLSGSGAPASGTGSDGDFYIRNSDWTIYGPKTAGAWGAPASLIGTAGSDGSNGTNGAAFLSGSGAPASDLGANGDWYFDTNAKAIHGPKTSGAWGSGTSLVGATGSAGSNGTAGATSTCARPRPTSSISTSVTPTGPSSSPSARSPVRLVPPDRLDRPAAGADGATLAGVNSQTGTSYTLVLADAAKLVECSNAAAITVTVPPQSSVAFPTGTVVHLAQSGAGQVTIAAGSGVTLKKHAAFNARTLGPDAVVSLAKIGTNTWRLFGLLEVA